MNEKVTLNLYLNTYRRREYILIYKGLQDKFNAMNESLFKDIEGAANEYREKRIKEDEIAYDYEVVDPAEIFERIEMETVDFYESEKLMEYNFYFSLLTMAYQIFEQQLRGFIYSELNHSTSSVRIKNKFSDFGSNMGQIKKAYELLSYDLTEASQWEDIEMLYKVVNTYKHGDGRSANNLYRDNPEMFLKSPFSKKD
ncbi:hypothetical protein [Kurthia massiliensis]|uniref:hypothetical protein n=1 Tax=Kurthia massiliensis TaxID=1033739 RepID=UPI000287C6D0|nr:hypothetical protein [Kurthia massiliensis]